MLSGLFEDLETPAISLSIFLMFPQSADLSAKEASIMFKIVSVISVAIVLSVSGCATIHSAPTVSQATSEGVTYRIKGRQLDQTKKLARDHCATSGRTAIQDRVSSGSGNERVVSYYCR